MDSLDSVFDPLRDFAKDSVRLVKRCHKPDRKGTTRCRTRNFCYQMLNYKYDMIYTFLILLEFTKVATRTAIGFVVMGFVGFFVKLIFIPINNIIVGAS